MRLMRTIAAATLAAASAITMPAFGSPAGAPVTDGNLVEQVRGCHRDVERHFVPEFGRSAWHYHRGSRCRPVLVDRPGPGPDPFPGPRPGRDCHSDARRHFVPGYGNVLHRHRRDCSVRILRRGDHYNPDFCVRIGPIIYCDR